MAEKPNLLLTFSAAAYFLVSVALIFTTEELLGFAAAAGTVLEIALLQLLGAALFGLAMLNWMSRYSRTGGIFGRPLVVANFANAFIATMMLVHLWREDRLSTPLMCALVFYAALALAFGAKLFLPPRNTRP